eukprot:gene236-286_t
MSSVVNTVYYDIAIFENVCKEQKVICAQGSGFSYKVGECLQIRQGSSWLFNLDDQQIQSQYYSDSVNCSSDSFTKYAINSACTRQPNIPFAGVGYVSVDITIDDRPFVVDQLPKSTMIFETYNPGNPGAESCNGAFDTSTYITNNTNISGSVYSCSGSQPSMCNQNVSTTKPEVNMPVKTSVITFKKEFTLPILVDIQLIKASHVDGAD